MLPAIRSKVDVQELRVAERLDGVEVTPFDAVPGRVILYLHGGRFYFQYKVFNRRILLLNRCA